MSEETATPEEETQEFEEAFSEFAAKSDDAADLDTEGEELPSEDAYGEKGEADDDGAAQEDAKAADPYAGLPDDVKARLQAQDAEIEKLSHRIKSDEGRVAAYQRQVDQLQQQIQQGINQGRSESDAAGTSQGETPTAGEVAEAMQTEEGWSEFTEEYPEIAAAIDQRLESKLGQFKGEVTETIKPVLTRAQEEEVNKGYEYLDSNYEGWRDRVASPIFQEWIETQPDVVQQLADSDDPREASSLIEFYDNYLTATGRMSEFQKPAGQNDPPNGGKDDDEAAALRRRRDQQLEDGDAIGSRGAGVGTGGSPVGDEFESAFNVYAAKKERERRSA